VRKTNRTKTAQKQQQQQQQQNNNNISNLINKYWFAKINHIVQKSNSESCKTKNLENIYTRSNISKNKLKKDN
jgi:hypothetical protein